MLQPFVVAGTDILHTLLPSSCRVCEGPMLGAAPVRVCDACLARVRLAAGNEAEAAEGRCPRCGDALGMESARFAGAQGVTECTACRLAPPEFDRAVSFAEYTQDVRAMLHTLKFDGMRRVADHMMGEWMAEAVLLLAPVACASLVVVPVPMFCAREQARGFNQAHLLARAAVKRLKRTHPAWRLELAPAVLERTRDTAALHALSPEQRRRSLRGAFRVRRPELVQGREVLLIDDILTTTATARACAQALRAAGATRVWVATVARARAESVQAVELTTARWDAPPV